MGGRGRRISEFKASLVYRVSSRTARATEKPYLGEKKRKKGKQQQQQQNKKKRREKKRKEKNKKN